ncbi:PEP-CTERM sorting domain-containing protein [Microcoleus sp. AR_TQ3_B6]|uniref:PEP-CTERM sorting domain-containing protein n=1 Tax=Microcoleus sp. AR_TQ3_B6 TaxID=3055284 RepID=UPI002FD62C44
MNTKFLSALTATAAATALFGAAAPAHAFSFGTNTIQFENDTQVIFNFRQSYGMFQSSLGIYGVSGGTPTFLKTLFSEVKSSDSGANNNWKGTLGNTVLGSGIATYTFLANQVYTLGLSSVWLDGSTQPTVYSSSGLNSGGSQQAVFGDPNVLLPLVIPAGDGAAFAGNAANFSSGSSLFNGGVAISFDDRGNGADADFQDFTVTAEAVPEPMTMTGLALGLGGLVAARRRRGSKTA